MVILDQIKYILYNRLNNGPLIYQALIVGAPKCYFIWEKSFVDVTKLRLKLRFLRWGDYPGLSSWRRNGIPHILMRDGRESWTYRGQVLCR